MDLASWHRDLLVEFGAAAGRLLDQAEVTIAVVRDDPARAWRDLEQVLTGSSRAAWVRQFSEDPLALDLFLGLGGLSRYGLDVVRQFPGAFAEAVQERQFRQVWGRQVLRMHLTATLEALGSVAARADAVGRFKHAQFLRILLADLDGRMGFPALVSELSDITAVVTQACLDLARQRLARVDPVAADAGALRFAVVAMGKLGARELNYSSDVDLIFLYETATGVDGHEAAQRLGRELIAVLEQPGDTGRAYRVDLRLRPEGDRGELALGLRETIDYYWSVGRPWERQAMLKAGYLAGDEHLFGRFAAAMSPWIWAADPAPEDLDEARSMRRRIEERARINDVKTGAGGIRDIEFLAQYFQLAYGGRIPDLRVRDTLTALRQLADRALLPRRHADELAEHYIWLRTVEHRLQCWDDRQEHEVPRSDPDRAALAFRCGLREADRLAQFDAEHRRRRARVRELCERHFLGVTHEQDAALAMLVRGEAAPELAATVLAPAGFTDLKRAAADLRRLADEPFFLVSRARTERRLAELLPLLLAQIGLTPDPDQTLQNLVKVVLAVGGRATFYDLLAARPDLMALVVDLSGWSAFLVQLLQDHPGLTDDLFDQLNLARGSSGLLLAEARAVVQGLNDPVPPLAFILARETAITAVHDLQGSWDVEHVGQRLSLVAETVAEVLLARVVQDHARQAGIPMAAGRPTRFAVLGLGKLGGRELSYASDMDVIFVCDGGGQCPKVERDGETFWDRVAQDFSRRLAEGQLYELDPRLRPWGDAGPLVSTVEGLRTYWGQDRDLWERLAMQRLRHLAGDPGLGAEAVAVILGAARGAPLPANAAAQVIAMRQRLAASVAGKDHVKRGPGGYVDVEFIVQFLSLGLPAGSLPATPATLTTLAALAAVGRLPSDAVAPLGEALTRLRFIENRLRLAIGKATSTLPVREHERDILARRCGYVDRAALAADLARLRGTARDWFIRLVG